MMTPNFYDEQKESLSDGQSDIVARAFASATRPDARTAILLASAEWAAERVQETGIRNWDNFGRFEAAFEGASSIIRQALSVGFANGARSLLEDDAHLPRPTERFSVALDYMGKQRRELVTFVAAAASPSLSLLENAYYDIGNPYAAARDRLSSMMP